MRFLMSDGRGDPNTSDHYRQVIEALYSTAYPLKFASKKTLGRDYVVPPLEGLWWADDPTAFTSNDRERWQWTMMLRIPDWVPPEMVSEAIVKAGHQNLLREETLSEGMCVQIMHIGPYSEEGPTLHRLHHEFMPENGWTFNGHHHEIYISDPRKADPVKMKTVLRQPVQKVDMGT